MFLKLRHAIGKSLGTVSAETCIGNGCLDYHGASASQLMMFNSRKNIRQGLLNIIEREERINMLEANYIDFKCCKCDLAFVMHELDVGDAMVCPACRGPIITKSTETKKAYADGEPIQTVALLTIELENETAIPKVFYKGKEITSKVNVHFDWDTEDNYGRGGLTYGFEHLQSDGTTEVMERRTKDHM